MRCSLCGRELEGIGNNPAPLITTDDGSERCCDTCNWDYVIPARLIELTAGAFPKETVVDLVEKIRAEKRMK